MSKLLRPVPLHGRQRVPWSPFQSKPKQVKRYITINTNNNTAETTEFNATKAMESIRTPIETNRTLLMAGQVERHGRGDAVIVLNVGGKEFCTLRSTVAASPVLREHVTRAEANQELTHGGTAVFIDRDPTHFQLILNHLRNQCDGLSYHSKTTTKTHALFGPSKPLMATEYRVQLPKDIRALRDIFVEASHYQIPELQAASCQQNFIVTVVGAFGGGNPFDKVNNLFSVLRRGMVAMGGVGTILVGSQHDQWLPALFPFWFPEEKKEEEKEAELKLVSE